MRVFVGLEDNRVSSPSCRIKTTGWWQGLKEEVHRCACTPTPNTAIRELLFPTTTLAVSWLCARTLTVGTAILTRSLVNVHSPSYASRSTRRQTLPRSYHDDLSLDDTTDGAASLLTSEYRVQGRQHLEPRHVPYKLHGSVQPVYPNVLFVLRAMRPTST